MHINKWLKSLEKQNKHLFLWAIILCVIVVLQWGVRKGINLYQKSNAIEYQEKLPSKVLLQGGKINLNTAQRHELLALPGIGPKKAKKILNYRKKHGPIQKLEDLTQISGIAHGILDSIRPFVVVRDVHEHSENK